MSLVYTLATNRTGFCAPPGYAIISVDYKSQEIAVAGVVSGDQAILDTFRAPAKIADPNGKLVRNPAADIYAIACLASFPELQKLEIWEVDDYIRHKCPAGSKKTYRDIGKQQVLAALYGQSAAGACVLWGIDVKEAQRRLDSFYVKFQKLKLWTEEAGLLSVAQGWSATSLGRIRCVREENSKGLDATALTGINTRIQGLSAQITKKAVKYVYDRLRHLEGMPCLAVHDEILGIIKATLIQEMVLDSEASAKHNKEIYKFKYTIDQKDVNGHEAVRLFEEGMCEAGIDILKQIYDGDDLTKICRVESAVSKYWEH